MNQFGVGKLSGVWPSLVGHVLWEHGVGGSNPLIPKKRRCFMIYILVLLSLALIIISLYSRRGDKEGTITLSVVCAVVFALATLCPYFESYGSMIRMMEDKATIEQHQQALKYYVNKGSRNFDDSTRQFPITDLKYQNYQSKVAELTVNLRDAISKYNSKMAGKKRMKKSPIFNWIIVMPDDTTELKMADYL